MHWNNGRFHDSIIVGKTIYITERRNIAITGNKDSTTYGEKDLNSYIVGKDVGITADNKFFADSTNGSDLRSKQYVRIESGNSTGINHEVNTGVGIEIVSKNGVALLSSERHDTNIRSLDSAVNISAGTYINLNAGTGITVNNSNYGTTLPTTGNVEGRVYYKLIS